jgi:hypothetical protein
MRNGVELSECFILFITTRMLEGHWCQMEIRWALELRKQVLVVYHTDPREGHGNPDFGFYINQIKRAFPSEDDHQWLLKGVAVPYDQRGGHDAVMVADILKQILPARVAPIDPSALAYTLQSNLPSLRGETSFTVSVVYCGDTEQEMLTVQHELQPPNIKLGYHVVPSSNDGSWLEADRLRPQAGSKCTQLVHIALHGSAQHGMRMVSHEGERALSAEDLIASLHRANEQLECIVLNMCNSRPIAEALMAAEPRRVQRVLFWNEPVLNSAVAKYFTSQFYRELRQQTEGPKSHGYRDAFDHSCIQLKRQFPGTTQSPEMWPAMLAMEQTEAGVPMNWGYVAEAWPSSSTGTVSRDFNFARLAGLHERECLRALGICVQRIEAVGSSTLVDIGMDAAGTLHGVSNRGFHDAESLCILFGCKAADLSGTCTTPGAQHRYVDLWPTVLGRVVSDADRPAAILHLEEAIWCRKSDLWCSQKAEVATKPSLAACLAVYSSNIPAGTSNKQQKTDKSTIERALLYPVVGALKMGLTESAAAVVASVFEAEFKTKAASHSLQIAAEVAANAARTERATLLADSCNLRPTTFWDNLSARTPTSRWHAFVDECQSRYATIAGPDPDGKSNFDAHLAMVNALESLVPLLLPPSPPPHHRDDSSEGRKRSKTAAYLHESLTTQG